MLDLRIDFSANDESLETVLNAVEKKSGASFSYSSGVIDKSRNITIVAQEASVKEILSSIFTGTSVGFSEIGNQIILYKKKAGVIATPSGYTTETVQVSEVLHVKPKAKTPKPTLRTVIDTIVVYDTIVILDTNKVTVFDTVRTTITDTVKVEQQPTQNRNRQNKSKSGSPISIILAGGMGYYSHTYSDNLLPDDQDINLSPNNSALTSLLAVEYKPKQVGFSLGWQLSNHKQTYSTDQISLTVDTIPVSYTEKVEWEVSIIDTIWVHNGTDSTQSVLKDSVPIVRQIPHYSSDGKDSILKPIETRILSIPIGFTYYYPISEKLTLGAGVVASFNFAITSQGAFYDLEKQDILQYGTNTVNLHSLSAGLSFSADYGFTNRIGMYASVRYLKHSAVLFSNTDLISKKTDALTAFAGFRVTIK